MTQEYQDCLVFLNITFDYWLEIDLHVTHSVVIEFEQSGFNDP